MKPDELIAMAESRGGKVTGVKLPALDMDAIYTPEAQERMKAYREAKNAPKPSKYRNVKTVVDGITFDSKKEATRYCALKVAEKAGLIQDLQLQPRYRIEVNGQKICDYIGDFQYVEHGKQVIEDVKSSATKTFVYRIKKKLLKAVHGIEITEIE